MTATEKNNTSLVLSGGGAYAAYEVGVMAALFNGRCMSTGYSPLDPDLLVGTSAGAMNVALLAAHEVRTGGLPSAVEEMRAIWLDQIAEGAERCGNGVYRIRGLPFNWLDRECLQRGLAPFLAEAVEDVGVFLRGTLRVASDFARSTGSPIRTVARSFEFSEFISTDPFQESLSRFLPLDDFARTKRRLRVVSLDLTEGHVKLFTDDDVRRFGYLPLRASTALPIFFPPRTLDGHVFISGSTLASTPLLPAISESNEMHLVYMDPEIRNIPRVRLQSIVDVLDRIMVVNFAYMFNRDIRIAREINTALEYIESGATGPPTPVQADALVRAISRIERRIREGNPYRKLTIHRYHPREDLGGDLGLMNLDRDRLAGIIQRGFDDTAAHDCETSGCVLPGRHFTHDGGPPPRRAGATSADAAAEARYPAAAGPPHAAGTPPQ